MNDRIDDKQFAKLTRIPQILIALMFSFSVFIFATINTYQLNKINFDFKIKSFLPYLLIMFAISMICILSVMTIARWINRRVFMIIVSSFFGLGIALYLQGNFLCQNYSVLMGEEPEWTSMLGPMFVNLAVWFFLVILMICFAMAKTRLFLKVATIVSVLLLVMEGGSIAVTEIFAASTNSLSQRAYSTGKDEFVVSDNGDIIVFLLDAFDSRNMQTAIEEYPEWVESFSDFTYYPNTASTYQRTEASCINMLTRERYYNQIPFFEWCDTALINSLFFRKMKENGYAINLYGISDSLFPIEMKEIADNLMPVEATIVNPYSFMYTFMKMTFYKFAPMALQPFMYSGDYLYLLRRDYDMTDKEATWNERETFERLVENGGFITESDRKYFKFYHFKGAHVPGDMDRYGNILEDESGTIQERALGSLYMVGKILGLLKKTGTYDNSMIVILGDHGSSGDGNVSTVCNPIFLTKYPGQKGNDKKMDINASAQVSVEDLAPTCLDGLGIDYSGLGEPARKWGGNNRERYFYTYKYFYPAMNGAFYLDYMVEYLVPEDARDLEQYVKTGNIFSH